MPKSVLLLTAPDAPAIEADLGTLGVRVAARSAAATLLRDAVRSHCEAVLAWDPYPATGLLKALDALQQHAPLPVLLFTTDAEATTLDEALRCGVHAYVVNGYAPARLRALLQLARARFEREAALRNAHDELAHRFEERKLVDRAKGILMRSLQVSEDEAFRLLRRASMQDQQRVGLVSRRVIDAARDAEAINRAGQLRMLSQRIVKLCALRQAGVGLDAAQRGLDESVTRVGENLAQLGRNVTRETFGDLLDAVGLGWRALVPLLRAGDDVALLVQIDEAAEGLLASAEALTAALEAASPSPTLTIVNRAGRQRMLSQRLAKQALLGTLLDGVAAQAVAEEAVRSMQAFEATLGELERSPLSTPLIRAELTRAGELWRRLTAGLRSADTAAGREVIAADSEALLASFEQLTELYSRGAQQLTETI
ncbi:MAG: type IV pili methyl-accepting chemotaxis transducer N-terminal domain-containing protein [Piscinibacter sp.]